MTPGSSFTPWSEALPTFKAALQRVRRACDVARDDVETRAFENAEVALKNAFNALYDAQRTLYQMRRDATKAERARARAEVRMKDAFVPSDEIRGKEP